MNVLAITAHPDDMEFKCAGTLIKCVKRGDNVFLCTINKQKNYKNRRNKNANTQSFFRLF